MKTTKESLAAEYITEALLILIKEKSYKDITITEICNKAGVTRMSFYRNFKSKDDIMKKWYHSVSDRFVDEVNFDISNLNKEFLVNLFTYLGQYREIYLAMYETGQFYQFVREQIERNVVKYERDLDEIYKSYFYTGGFYSTFILWLKRGQKESPSELADKLEQYLVD